VHQPIRQKGEESAKLLLRMIASPDAERPEHRVLETRLIIRASTAPAPAPAAREAQAGRIAGQTLSVPPRAGSPPRLRRPPRSFASGPDWVRDAVFYQIFVDRFAASARVPKPGEMEPWDAPPTIHGFKGGDLLGIAEHLDDLAALGITALYLTPVFASASNHRYHTFDYETGPPSRWQRGPA